MCMALNNRLAGFLEAKEILADEQGGFCRSRGCRDQILPILNSIRVEAQRLCGLCGGMLVSSLLFTDDIVLLAESAEDMRRSLQCVRNGLWR